MTATLQLICDSLLMYYGVFAMIQDRRRSKCVHLHGSIDTYQNGELVETRTVTYCPKCGKKIGR